MRSEVDRVAAMVLVVEDEAALSDVVQAYLVKAGYATASARSGPEAVEMARALAPDVIVLDLGLPDAVGLQAVARIQADGADLVLVDPQYSPRVTERPESARGMVKLLGRIAALRHVGIFPRFEVMRDWHER